MMLKSKFLFLFFTCLLMQGYSRNNIVPAGGRPAGMANAFVSQFDEFAVFHNQAGLAKIQKTSISFFYENKFLVKQMSSKAALFAFPSNAGNFAFQINSFGPSRWAESNVGLAYSRFLNEKLASGLQLNYFGTRLAEDNTTAKTASFELGFIYQISDKTALGAHLANPLSTSLQTMVYDDDIPWRIKLGGHSTYTNNFILSYEVEVIENFDPIFKAGIQWEAVENVFLRGGVNTSPTRMFGGFGYISELFEFDMAFSYHQYLGYVPAVSVKFSLF